MGNHVTNGMGNHVTNSMGNHVTNGIGNHVTNSIWPTAWQPSDQQYEQPYDQLSAVNSQLDLSFL